MSRFIEVLIDGTQPPTFVDADKIVALQRRVHPSGDWFWLATMDNAMTFRLTERTGDSLIETQSPTEIAALKKEAAAP